MRIQALELLSMVLDYMIDPDAPHDKLAISDVVHQLIVNGCTTALPALLTFYADTRNELSTRRAINCLNFVIRNSPHDLTMTLITVII